MSILIYTLLIAAPAFPVIATSPELAVTSAARSEAASLRVTAATFIGMPRPGPNVEFSASLLQSHAADRVTVEVEARVKGVTVARRIYELSLTTAGVVVVPTRTIAAGRPIEAAELELKAIELGGPPGRFASNKEEVTGRISKVALLPGRPVPLAEVEAPDAVARGDEVRVAIRAGGMEVTTLAEALDAGAIGARVRARNRSTQKILSAVVIGPGQLEANNP